jgi:hypothetical protein
MDEGYMNSFIKYLNVLTIPVFLVACSGGGGGEEEPEPVNRAPTVNAGSDIRASEQSMVNLSGSASDSDGSISSYSWVQTAGYNVTLSDASTLAPTFEAPIVLMNEGEQSFTFELTVTDNEGASAKDSVSVVVEPVNDAPTVNAGDNQSVLEQQSVQLNGASSDTDGTVATITWTQVSGAEVTLQSADSLNASFIAPIVLVTDGIQTLVFELSVTDNEGSTVNDQVEIIVNPTNELPSVSAGQDFSVDEQLQVSLTGVASDTDGVISNISWSQNSGMAVSLTNPSALSTTFTAPTVLIQEGTQTLSFELAITDNEGGISTDTVIVTVSPVNQPPTITLEESVNGREGQTLTFDITASDEDGTVESTQWLQVDGAQAVLVNDSEDDLTIVIPSLSADATLQFSVTATDNEGAETTDTVTLSAVNNPIGLNDTGYISCGDYAFDSDPQSHSNALSCATATDDDGDPVPQGQDGHSGRDVALGEDFDGAAGFSFTKLSDSGVDLPNDSETWSCVRDNMTGLIWEVKTTDNGLRDADSTYSWYSSNSANNGGLAGTENGGSCTDAGNCDTEKFAASVNVLGLCGATDWRLPTKEELASLVNYQMITPTIDVNYFPNTRNIWYATNSPFSNSSFAWNVNFSDGSINYSTKASLGRLRLVRLPSN